MIQSVKELQKIVMLNSNRFWNVNDLTDVLREKCKQYGFAGINHSTVERNIRHFREQKHALVVQKRKTDANTWEYKISTIQCTAAQYAARK